jgi:hypothetical protein
VASDEHPAASLPEVVLVWRQQLPNKTVTAVRAIETTAYGHRFRSRLEARYAVFLASMGVSWQYEPQGFNLPSGNYLPDFFLPLLDGGTWMEIKPYGVGSYFGFAACNYKGIPRLRDERLYEFAEYARTQNQRFYIAYGIPSDVFLDHWADYNEEGILEAAHDPHAWCVCACGKTVGIQFDGRGDRITCPHPGCHKSSHGDKGYSFGHDRIRLAVNAARSARFEHSQSK